MKTTLHHTSPLALLTIVTALLSACSSPTVAPTAASTAPQAAAQTPAPTAPSAATGTSQPAPASSVSTTTLPAYLDPKSEISTNRSVYFDFDSAVVKPEFNGLVATHGKYLGAHPELHIRIEGNADERGSAEYNLALGQRRAEAVRHALQLIGVKDGQMEAISWGSEKPRVRGHDEAAWAQNRRADLQYPSK